MRKFLFLLSFLASLVGVGQGVLDLEKAYSINAVQHGDKELGQVYTLDEIKAKFPAFYGRKTSVDKFTDAQVKTCRVFSAAYMDAIVKTCAFGPNAPLLVSVVNIDLPNGRWLHDLDGVLSYGTVTGKGTFLWYPTNTSTEIVMDNAGWQGTLKDETGKPVRTLFVSPSYGQEAFTAAYHESMSFGNVRLNGACADTPDASYLSYGLYVWDMGETGSVEKIYAHNFNTAGFAFERGTPVHSDNLTAFNCHYTGIHLRGTALATMRMSGSVDDAPSVWRMDPSWGREAGGALSFTLVKKETGVTPEVPGRFWNGTIVGYCQGQFTVNVDVVSNAAGAVTVPTMFFVNAVLKNGTPQRSSIFVAASKSFNCQAFVHDAANDGVWMLPAQYAGMCLYYTTHNGGKAIVDMNEVLPKVATPCNERLGFFRGSGTFDYQRCTPALATGGTNPGPVTPCTGWTTGAWSTCTNGTQTRTVTATPAGCTGTPANKPAESQTCTIAPVVPKWTRTYGTATYPETKAATRVAAPNGTTATQVVLKDFKITGAGFTFIGSHLFYGTGGTLWTKPAVGPWVDTKIPVKVGEVVTYPPISLNGVTINSYVGSTEGSTATFTGTIEYY